MILGSGLSLFLGYLAFPIALAVIVAVITSFVVLFRAPILRSGVQGSGSRRRGSGGLGGGSFSGGSFGGGGSFSGGGASGRCKRMRRILQHARTGRWHVRRHLATHNRNAGEGASRITEAVTAAERGHSGEIRVVLEASPGIAFACSKRTARDRAIEVFTQERVWDSAENNGVLLYLLLADRNAEIVADRGLNDKVDPAEWEALCQHLERDYHHAGLVHAVCHAVQQIGELLRRSFPASVEGQQLPDEPVVR